MQLVLDTRNMLVKHRNGCFHLSTVKHERLIAPQKIQSIVVTAPVVLTTAAIRLAVKHTIPVYFLDAQGRVEARLGGPAFGHLTEIRRHQVLFASSPQATVWAVELFSQKLTQQKQLLVWLLNRKPGQKDTLQAAIDAIEGQQQALKTCLHQPLPEVAQSLMGIEGSAARAYWQAVAVCMPEGFVFTSRNRRPATDAFNAAINYLYGMLYTVVETALFSVGLDPYLGVLHADQYNKPALSYDLIEPFRPWMDRLVVESILQQSIQMSFFDTKAGAVTLNKAGKHFLIPACNKLLADKTTFGESIATHKTHIYRAAGMLIKILEEYAQSV